MKYILDATNQSLGRLASKIAFTLRGKNQASYEPNKLPVNVVTIKNLEKAKFTGKKFDQVKYHHYSGYHSGIKSRSLSEIWGKNPEWILRQMVQNMLPKNKLRAKIIKNLNFE